MQSTITSSARLCNPPEAHISEVSCEICGKNGVVETFSSLKTLDFTDFSRYPSEFCRDGTTSKRWVPMGKSIANLYRYAGISKAVNKRFLDSMCNVIPLKSIEKAINGVCEKKNINGKTYTGYNVWSPEIFQLFEEISDGRYLIR